jgi:hypothetical protein
MKREVKSDNVRAPKGWHFERPGKSIRSAPPTPEYEDGWMRIWGKKEKGESGDSNATLAMLTIATLS